MKALVLRGSRNLFTVRNGTDEYECRIKGKILKEAEGYYNPLAPGDIIEAENGLIIGLEKRKNHFARFNQKGQSPQILAANVDLVLCMTSTASPPFRPRFIDRLLLEADYSEIPAAIICNKYDISPDDPDVEERLEDFVRIGVPVFRISAKTGEGMDEFMHFIQGKTSVITGQSGVGKSTLIKKLIPGVEIKTAAINEKYSRGNHTTIQAYLYELPDSKTAIIDTPGVRRFAPERVKPEDVILYMREFASLAGKCSYGLSCFHITEPGCKILEAVHAGVIHEDRYESFLRIRDEMSEKAEYPDND
jgi:ribosome biogenesis GTPase